MSVDQTPLSASAVYRRCGQLINKIQTSIQRIVQDPNVSSETLRQTFAIQAEAEEWQTKWALWWSEFEKPIRELEQRLNSAHRTADAAVRQKAVDDLNAEVQRQHAIVEAFRQKPSADGNTILQEGELINDRIREIHFQLSGKSIEQKTEELFKVDRTELLTGLNFHRDQAYWMLVGLAVASTIGGVLIFFTLGIDVDLRSDAPTSLTIVKTIAHLAGRFSVLAGIGWLLLFIGNLHSRHSQQAVSYRDRLAALDVASLVMHYGAPAAKEQALLAVVHAYVSDDSNAFKQRAQAPRHPDAEIENALKLADPLLKRVHPLIKELRAGSRE